MAWGSVPAGKGGGGNRGQCAGWGVDGKGGNVIADLVADVDISLERGTLVILETDSCVRPPYFLSSTASRRIALQ